MAERRRPALVWGALLILLGLAFLVVQLFGWPAAVTWARAWPLIVIGAAVVLAGAGLLARTPGLAVPACVVGGIGLLLYYQNATGDWASWAFTWPLIPGFAGLGILLAGLFAGKLRSSLTAALWLILISVVMFVAFGSYLGPWRGLGLLRYWPLLLILIGLIALVRSLAGRAE